MRRLLLILFPFVLLGCQSGEQQSEVPTQNAYAQGFAIVDGENYQTVVVYSPWENGKELERYYLVTNEEIETPQDGLRIVIPVTKWVATSATHVGFLHALNETDRLVGVCNKERIYTPLASECTDLGDDIQLSTERVLLTYPQAIMLNTYGESDLTPARLQKTGIPLIYNIEWTEQHPLGKAEWIRFVGAFAGKQQEADSVFRVVVEEYERLRSLGLTVPDEERKRLLTGNDFRGTWYVPAGNTYMGMLIQDAGARYAFAGDKSGQSVPLSIEKCLLHFQDADVWIGSNAHTLNELAQIDEKHTWFKAYQTGEVYNFEKRATQEGANDFWETGTVHPEYILQDLIWALYPEVIDTDYEPWFVEKLD